MIRVGTSGWTYPHWQGLFYPEELPQRRWLEHYAASFHTVELNASFYRIPKAETVRGWRKRTPESFRFAVKASRLITHVHRLSGVEETLEWFFRELEPLREASRIEAFLFQLPPSFSPSPELLERFCNLLPEGNRYVFELRNPKTFEGAVPGLLKRKGMGFCIHDFPGRESPLLITSNLVYLRLHGYSGRYAGSYPDEVLKLWARRIAGWSREGRDALVYFNNDLAGSAVFDALKLRTYLEGAL